MNTVTLLIIFMVNPDKAVKVEHIYPTLEVCRQEIPKVEKEFGHNLIMADCYSTTE